MQLLRKSQVYQMTRVVEKLVLNWLAVPPLKRGITSRNGCKESVKLTVGSTRFVLAATKTCSKFWEKLQKQTSDLLEQLSKLIVRHRKVHSH